MPNAGWRHYRAIDIEADYGLSIQHLNEILRRADSFSDFVRSFYKPVLAKSNKLIWAEKTPSNAFTLYAFSKAFPQAQTIHIVRNPLDSIASLVQRGVPIYDAICVHLLSTSEALKLNVSDRHYLIKYEDLVTKPNQSVSDLLKFLKLNMEDHILEANDQEGGVVTMQGWNYKETGAIGSKSINRFQKLDVNIQKKVLSYISAIRSTLNPEIDSVAKLAEVLGYQNIEILSPDKTTIQELRSIKRWDVLKRTIKQSYYSSKNYPISING